MTRAIQKIICKTKPVQFQMESNTKYYAILDVIYDETYFPPLLLANSV